MGLKSPWFQILVLCLCVSTVANSKPLSVLKPEVCSEFEGAGSCNTAKEGIVHKVETRNVRDQDYTVEHRKASDAEEPFNIDSLNDFDTKKTDNDHDGDSSLDEKTSSGDVSENIGGARADNTVDDGDGINVVPDPELPQMIIHDNVDDTSDDNPVVDDDDVTPEDDDDTSGDHDDYASDLLDEAQDIHDDDSYDDDNERNSSDDDDDTFDVDDDADEDDNDVEEMPEDDDDRYDDDDGDDVDHVINTSEHDDDATYEGVVNDTPDATFGVDDVADDHRPDSNGNNMEGPVPEEPPHKYAKATRHHHNPLNKHPDTKLGRLLKKHQGTGMSSDKSGRKNLHDDIYDDDDDKDYVFQKRKDNDDDKDYDSQKRKDKFQSHKGRRTLSLEESSDFDHVDKTNYPEEEDQEDGENSAEKSADNDDKQFGVDLVKQAGSVAETTAVAKGASPLVQEDPIEGEEEENQRAKVDSSASDYENIKAVSSPEETGQHYEEDKIEGEET